MMSALAFAAIATAAVPMERVSVHAVVPGCLIHVDVGQAVAFGKSDLSVSQRQHFQ